MNMYMYTCNSIIPVCPNSLKTMITPYRLFIMYTDYSKERTVQPL